MSQPGQPRTPDERPGAQLSLFTVPPDETGFDMAGYAEWTQAEQMREPEECWPPDDSRYPPAERLPNRTLWKITDDHNPIIDPAAARQVPLTTLELLEADPHPFAEDGPIGNYRGTGKTQGFRLGKIGDTLNDNSRQQDGYRFHDVFHLSFMAGTGWSAVTRSLLNVKRRSNPEVNDAEDGQRAIQIEEQLFASMGSSKAFVDGLWIPDTRLLEYMYAFRNAADKILRPMGVLIGGREWERGVKLGQLAFALVRNTIGNVTDAFDTTLTPEERMHSAYLEVNKQTAQIRLSFESAEAAKAAEPLELGRNYFFPANERLRRLRQAYAAGTKPTGIMVPSLGQS